MRKSLFLLTLLFSIVSVHAETTVDKVKQQAIKSFIGPHLKSSPDYVRIRLSSPDNYSLPEGSLFLGADLEMGEDPILLGEDSMVHREWLSLGLLPASVDKCEDGCDKPSHIGYLILGRKREYSKSSIVEQKGAIISPDKDSIKSSHKVNGIVTKTKILELQNSGLGTQLELFEYLYGLGASANVEHKDNTKTFLTADAAIGPRIEIGRSGGLLELVAQLELQTKYKDIIAIKVKTDFILAPHGADLRFKADAQVRYHPLYTIDDSEILKSTYLSLHGRFDGLYKPTTGESSSVGYSGIGVGIEF